MEGDKQKMLMRMSLTMCSMKGFHSFHDHSSSKKEYHPKEPIIIGHIGHSLRWALYTHSSTNQSLSSAQQRAKQAKRPRVVYSPPDY